MYHITVTVTQKHIIFKCVFLKSIYFRTTTYDRRSGGFITSVSTEDVNNDDDDDENDENSNKEQRSHDDEKLILSKDTYNTLTRSSNKKTVSFYNASSSMKRKMSSFETQSESLSGGENIIPAFF